MFPAKKVIVEFTKADFIETVEAWESGRVRRRDVRTQSEVMMKMLECARLKTTEITKLASKKEPDLELIKEAARELLRESTDHFSRARGI